MRPDLKRVMLICTENRDFKSAISLMKNQIDLCDFADARLMNFHDSYDTYKKLELLDIDNVVNTDFALIIHLDGYIVHPECWTPEFLNYDFIGAPWPERLNKDRVGNGGFSLRSKRLIHRVAQLPLILDAPADVVLCSHYRKLLESEGFRFAPVDVAARFAIEFECPETVRPTFGFHSTCNYPRWKAC